jgi:hypothetical protein
MAISYQEYVDILEDNLSLHQLHYNKFKIDQVNGEKIEKFKACKILVISEPWCGDSLALLPIIRKISEINNRWEIKILLRDSNLDLMDQFLTRGVRGMPMFLFLNENGDFQFSWGPRPEGATQIFESHREQINDGKIDMKEVIKKIRVYYAKDRGIRTLKELMQLFEKNGLLSDA